MHIYLGQMYLPPIDHRCMEYCYTKEVPPNNQEQGTFKFTATTRVTFKFTARDNFTFIPPASDI